MNTEKQRRRRKSEARVAELKARREEQRSGVPGILKANDLVTAFDRRTKKPIQKRLIAMPKMRPNRYRPHQGKQEAARRLRQQDRRSVGRIMDLVVDNLERSYAHG